MSQVKYRAACDHCSNTKTKCPQERPQCGRCRALGRECHYSISLRHGKRPGSASLAQSKKSSRAPSVSQDSTTPLVPESVIVPKTDPTVWNNVSSATYPTPPSIAPSLTINAAAIYELPRTDETTTSTPSPSLGGTWPFDMHSLNMLNDMHSGPLIDSASPTDTYSSSHETDIHPRCDSITQTMEFGSFDELIGMATDRSNAGDQCVKLATETLQSLYDIASVRHEQMHMPRQNPTADQVLSTASKAMQDIVTLLSCPCTKDFYLPIVIAMIASKILAWYQAVVFVRDPYTEPLDGRRCSKELVADRPLTLGAYQLDDELEWTLKNQLVLGQLHKMNEIVGRYHTLFCGSGFSGQVAEGGRLYSSTGGFLRARLLYTIQEIEGRLQATIPV